MVMGVGGEVVCILGWLLGVVWEVVMFGVWVGGGVSIGVFMKVK